MTVEETETKTMKEENVTLGSELIYPTPPNKIGMQMFLSSNQHPKTNYQT
jgi:hypothetical protein